MSGTNDPEMQRRALEDRGDHVELVAIEGAQLSAVTFVRDYVQLHFDGPMLTALTWPTVIVGNTVWSFSSSGYRDALCAQIAKSVRRGIVVPSDRLQLTFEDESQLVVSLRPEDRAGAEAVVFNAAPPNKSWEVW